MKIPLVPDQRDFRWQLLKRILNTFDLRNTKKIISKYAPLKRAIPCLKIVTTSMFFSTTINHVLEELRKKKLRNILEIDVDKVPTKGQIYSFMSKFSVESFIDMVKGILNSTCKKRQRNTKLIVDCTDISVDINHFRKPINQRNLEGKEYRWGYSTKGKFIGMKMTLVIEYPSLKPLLFLIHPANRHESPLYPEIMGELKRRRIIRKGDTLFLDRGFYAYKNYTVGINKYKVVPVIFPRKNFNGDRLDGLLSYPLSIFGSKSVDKEKSFFRKLKSSLMARLKNWQTFKPVRSVIEDLFKVAKSMGLRNLHRYTMRSVYKYSALNVLLLGMVVSLGVRGKRVLQRLAES
jgi:hypothetical protein